MINYKYGNIMEGPVKYEDYDRTRKISTVEIPDKPNADFWKMWEDLGKPVLYTNQYNSDMGIPDDAIVALPHGWPDSYNDESINFTVRGVCFYRSVPIRKIIPKIRTIVIEEMVGEDVINECEELYIEDERNLIEAVPKFIGVTSMTVRGDIFEKLCELKPYKLRKLKIDVIELFEMDLSLLWCDLESLAIVIHDDDWNQGRVEVVNEPKVNITKVVFKYSGGERLELPDAFKPRFKKTKSARK